MSLDRELTGIVFAINLHPAGGQVVLYKIIIIMITFLTTIFTTMTIIVNLHPAVVPYKIIIIMITTLVTIITTMTIIVSFYAGGLRVGSNRSQSVHRPDGRGGGGSSQVFVIDSYQQNKRPAS